MPLDFSYPSIKSLFPQYLDPKRWESASFLAWYLENYYRLDPEEALDSVCDESGDKGIDGIYVNDDDLTITVFQSRIRVKSGPSSIGDADLRGLQGALAQFASAETLRATMKAAGDARVAQLIDRLSLADKIATHFVRGEFLSNVELDGNGDRYIAILPNVSFVGPSKLNSSYISNSRSPIERADAAFDITGFQATEYPVDANAKAIIAPVKAAELVKMDGIENQAIFHPNVRGPLGRTVVNRAIAASVGDQATHKEFLLFHNGITIICEKFERSGDRVTISGYYVINGCQSLTALYESKGKLTDDLRILTKIIQLDPESKLAELITRNSNTQNGVSDRDFMSNDPKQIRLQNEFAQEYEGEFVYEIKRGEALATGPRRISNEDAGLLLMAFDLKMPWNTHRKYDVFKARHSEIFGRPVVTAHRVVLCQTIADAVDVVLPEIENTLIGKYRLTKYLLIYVVRSILESEKSFADVSALPEDFVKSADDRKRFMDGITRVVRDTVPDLNAELKELPDDFDYRGKLRDEDWVRQLAIKLVSFHQILVTRGRIPSFMQEFVKGASGAEPAV